MSIIDMQARGLKVVRRPEAIAGAHAQEVADLTAYAKRRIAEIRAEAERARDADQRVIELHRELSYLADKAIFLARNYDRELQINNIMLAMANKVAHALKS